MDTVDVRTGLFVLEKRKEVREPYKAPAPIPGLRFVPNKEIAEWLSSELKENRIRSLTEVTITKDCPSLRRRRTLRAGSLAQL